VIVADINLIAYFAVRDVNSELADAVFEADPVWVAPLLWRSEWRNALTKYIRHAGLSLESALVALRSAEEVVGGREYRVASEKVFELAMQTDCSAYDCEYVALAQDLGVPLVTGDPQVLRAFPKTAIALEKFARKRK